MKSKANALFATRADPAVLHGSEGCCPAQAEKDVAERSSPDSPLSALSSAVREVELLRLLRVRDTVHVSPVNHRAHVPLADGSPLTPETLGTAEVVLPSRGMKDVPTSYEECGAIGANVKGHQCNQMHMERSNYKPQPKNKTVLMLLPKNWRHSDRDLETFKKAVPDCNDPKAPLHPNRPGRPSGSYHIRFSKTERLKVQEDIKLRAESAAALLRGLSDVGTPRVSLSGTVRQGSMGSNSTNSNGSQKSVDLRIDTVMRTILKVVDKQTGTTQDVYLQNCLQLDLFFQHVADASHWTLESFHKVKVEFPGETQMPAAIRKDRHGPWRSFLEKVDVFFDQAKTKNAKWKLEITVSII